MEHKGRDYPNGLFYRRACELMMIDPDNNPNYRTDSLPNHLYDKAGNPIKITITKPTHLIPMTQLTEHMCNILSEGE